MSQTTMTFLRSQRSTSTPADGAEEEARHDAGPTARGRRRPRVPADPVRQRGDGDEADPVAEARRQTWASQSRKNVPRRRRAGRPARCSRRAAPPGERSRARPARRGAARSAGGRPSPHGRPRQPGAERAAALVIATAFLAGGLLGRAFFVARRLLGRLLAPASSSSAPARGALARRAARRPARA